MNLAKRVTSMDVAKRAGVSRTTVSFVLNKVEGMQISEETKKRVFTAAHDLGYVPDAAAQALASGRSKTIGLFLARRSQVIASDMYLTQVMEVLVHEVNRHGMRLLLEVVEDYEHPDSYLKLVRSNSIDGVLYSGPLIQDSALRSLIDHGIPTVLMGNLPNMPYPSVDIDNRAAAERAVQHLIQLGHRRIACITNANPSYSGAAGRLQGYRDALDCAGIPFEVELVRYGDFDPESGFHQMNNLIEAGKPMTAAFVASDIVALGAMAAIREHGMEIPQDIALVGFDDVPVAKYIHPSLTTIKLPMEELTRCACDMLVGMIRGKHPEQKNVLLEAKLIVRKSCGAASIGMHRPELPVPPELPIPG
ncbi:MAG: LacI family DNA-binding transcriptional regulator [Anaerolineaceae bacterium]|nr:LacI family DNA-binding transcriptional regulator [Anaerolineaceae bacterium]